MKDGNDPWSVILFIIGAAAGVALGVLTWRLC